MERVTGGDGHRKVPLEQALPERVRQAIRDQEEFSEILIGWAQLAIVATFAVLYALAPRAAGAAVGALQPVPFALGGYFLFTIARLTLAYRRFTPGWFLDLSIALDMALLLGLIWTFHLQYQQPASFYLKSPTLLYVFIFIALRALRFDPRFVLTAGLMAAGGWLVLVFYAVAQDLDMDMVTRNYVEYLTGNKILMGAEFDKVISILLVTLVLTLALVRARKLLVTAVREGAAADDLKRFFAPEIAQAITGAEHEIAAGQGEARNAAVLMIDIRNFTGFAASIPPNDVMRLLAGYQAHMVPVIQRCGGSIDKFLGDGIMATFGAGKPSETAAADALRAMQGVLEAARIWNAWRAAAGYTQVLTVNAAAASGMLIWGAVGDESRLEYTVIGDPVNLAAKLEKHNKALGVAALTTGATLDAALDQGFEPAKPPHRIPGALVGGIDEPLELAVIDA
ncbi:MAG: adenylate/guanylate cyclase domain-containing protein [Inquilinus sp.]|nr:adenylate/guanylate cyclase domain-containing protein [Inquilinus sp.]